MTEEQIEIKSREYAEGRGHEHYNFLFEENAGRPVDFARLCYADGLKDGANFGYNKANEWHYVKDGLPQYNEYVLIYTDLKNTYVARIPTEKDYFITRRGGFVQMSAVIAWKEIVLPKKTR